MLEDFGLAEPIKAALGKLSEVERGEVKHLFRDGSVQLLLCTDAAAHGLNFHFCGPDARLARRSGPIAEAASPGRQPAIVWLQCGVAPRRVGSHVAARALAATLRCSRAGIGLAPKP